MTGASQSQIAAELKAQLDRLRSADPFRTLEVPPQVDAEGVRRAYLVLTKKFHPNRFALQPAPTRDLANEVFLLIRRAYDQLVDDDKRRQWRERVAPASATLPRAPTAGAVASSTTPPKGATVPASVPPRAATAQASPPPPVTTLRPTGTIPTVPAAGSRPPPTGTGAPVRTQTVPGAPPGPTTRRPLGPPTSGASPQEVQAMLEAARTRGQRFDDAVALISRGRYREAREAFYKIAMEDPQSKRYRVQLHYAWGLEHLADGKPAEGQRELERALALEPESADIKAALGKATEQQKKPSGILGKLFGK